MDWSRIAFLTSLGLVVIGGSFGYGVIASRGDLQPIPIMRSAYKAVREVVAPADRMLGIKEPRHEDAIAMLLPDAAAPGLVVVAADVAVRETAVRVMDREGRTLHEWRPLWREVWPEGEGEFPMRPRKGMYLHGVAVLPDGSLVANFEHQSTFRMDPCGKILWKLDNLGHHSVHVADNGTIWVAAETYFPDGPTGYPLHAAPLNSWTLQNISPDGEILRTIPVIDILLQNGLEGLLYMSTVENTEPSVSGDTLHLNDVETFPADLASDIFEPGDIMMSLRNIHAVIVVDSETLDVKFLSLGKVMRQHDPDFMAGDRISVFDNRTFTRSPIVGPAHSRIVELDTRDGSAEAIIDSSNASEPFFSEIWGMHQRLGNGNVLVVPTAEGRVLEFTPDGRLVWRYDNRLAPDLNMRIYMAGVLPETMDAEFFERITTQCALAANP